MDQLVRFTPVNGRTVAWSSAGSGPALVVGGWWCSHLELDWRNTRFRQFWEQFTDRFTVIRYDRPGTGLSDRDGLPITELADEVATLAAVVDQVGAPVTLLAASSGGCPGAAFTAAYPNRVDRLVLYGCYANGAEITEAPARRSILEVVARHWGVGSRLLADLMMPNATAGERAEFARFQRESATPDCAVVSLGALYEFDVRDRLPAITVPTLVLHRREDRAIPFALGRDVASRIPGAAFVALNGTDHFPWLGDADSVVRNIIGFADGGDKPAVDTPAEPAAAGSLSTREVEVLRMVAQGLSDNEIATRLVLSVHTVHRHVANIRTKLGLASRTAAAAHAIKAGLI